MLADAKVEVAAIWLCGPLIGGDVFRTEGIRALNHGVIGTRQVGRAAPHFWQGSGQRLDGRFGGFTGGNRITWLPYRQLGVEVFWQFAGRHTVKERLILGVFYRPSVELFLPLRVLFGTAFTQLAGVSQDLIIDVEGLFWIEAEHFLGGGNFVIAKRGAVDATGVHLGGGRVTDHRLDADEGGALRFLLGIAHCLFNGDDVLAGFNRLDVPAVCLISPGDVLVEGDIGVILDGNAVIVPENDKVA